MSDRYTPAMRTDKFTSTILSIIALALIILAFQGWSTHSTTVQAAATGQAWEYKFVSWSYSPKGDNTLDGVTNLKEDARPVPPQEDGKPASAGRKILE